MKTVQYCPVYKCLMSNLDKKANKRKLRHNTPLDIIDYWVQTVVTLYTPLHFSLNKYLQNFKFNESKLMRHILDNNNTPKLARFMLLKFYQNF